MESEKKKKNRQNPFLHLWAFPFPPPTHTRPRVFASPLPLLLFSRSISPLRCGLRVEAKWWDANRNRMCRTVVSTCLCLCFPQMLPRSDWDHKRGSRGSQVSTVHRAPQTHHLSACFIYFLEKHGEKFSYGLSTANRLPGAGTQLTGKHTHQLPDFCHSPSHTHLINDANSRNPTTNRPAQPLVSAVVKQHVQRCHFPPESLLYSVSLKDAGLWFGCKALRKPLKAGELKLEGHGTEGTACRGQTHTATSFRLPFPSLKERVHVCELMYRAAVEPQGRTPEYIKNKQCPWRWRGHIQYACAACAAIRRISFRNE